MTVFVYTKSGHDALVRKTAYAFALRVIKQQHEQVLNGDGCENGVGESQPWEVANKMSEVE